MESFRFQVMIEEDEDGVFVNAVPELQGCYTQGDTVEEALENIREVISLIIEDLREDGKPIPQDYTPIPGAIIVEVTA